MCGDATNIDDVQKVLGDLQPALFITDPPYGVAIGDKNVMLYSKGTGRRNEEHLQGDQSIKEVEELWRRSFPIARQVLSPGTPYYIFGPQGGDLGLLLLLLRDSDLAARHVLTWVKNRAAFSFGRLDYDYAHEPIMYGWVKGAGHPWYAKEPQTSCLYYDRPAASKLHPTMKPVALIAHLITNSTKKDDTVFDVFGGSGTTLIACEKTGRQCRMMEIDPHYCDVIVKRYEDFTGASRT